MLLETSFTLLLCNFFEQVSRNLLMVRLLSKPWLSGTKSGMACLKDRQAFNVGDADGFCFLDFEKNLGGQRGEEVTTSGKDGAL